MQVEEFNKIYCINLERRPDRRELADRYFKQIGLNVEFINGVDGESLPFSTKVKKGHAGCILSHKKIFEECQLMGYEKVLVLEDDVEFIENYKELFFEYYKEVPDDWELLYFGGNHNALTPKMVSPHVHRLTKTFTTHCYAFKSSALGAILKEFNRTDLFTEEVDVHLSNVQNIIPSYGFIPSLAWQREGFSDIENKHVNYTFLK